MQLLALVGMPGGIEWIIIGVVALLIFGRRLPSVARSLGSSYNQFRAGLREDAVMPPHNSIDDEPATTSGDSEPQNETQDTPS
jgi:sec-independent protein translocase protein TatA